MKLGLPGSGNKNTRIYQVKLFATKRIEESASNLFSGRHFATARITYTRRILLNYKGPFAASQSFTWYKNYCHAGGQGTHWEKTNKGN